ncbi:hypothetical protein TNCV_1233151 [Trichonephila clavipes]|nr:hypothetical protein TNCV_1233151 [Trichonephila clavipes]
MELEGRKRLIPFLRNVQVQTSQFQNDPNGRNQNRKTLNIQSIVRCTNRRQHLPKDTCLFAASEESP